MKRDATEMNGTKSRVFNFSAGPCCLPVEVLEEAREEMLNYRGSGMSVMEMSHRGKDFIRIFDDTKNSLKEVLAIPDTHKILFMQGGASLQFSAVPLNLLKSNTATADYAITGSWGDKAFKECEKFGKANKVCDTKSSNYTSIPSVKEWKMNEDASFLHYCANETIYGVEFHQTPEVSVPLVSDMSSNFCSKPIDFEKHTLVYAGAQKNLGPAGAAVVIVKEDCLGKELPICPTICSYKTMAANDSMYNTPPCWTIYMIGLMTKHMKEMGGIQHWKDLGEKKANRLYEAIHGSNGYYSCPVNKDCRSNMNVPFRVARGDEALEKKFLEEAKTKHLVSLGGHRSVGGCRASIYNGMPLSGVESLVDFMKAFREENPV